MGEPVQEAPSEPLPTRIGRYRILCELGTGSMATLYLARMTGLGRFERLFAVKITHEHLSKERSFVEMFMNEARIAAKIQHPNVIPVYEIDVERGRYYMVMDYVSGETLALTLKHTWNKDRPFPVAYAAQVLASACEGLHAAHELKGSDGHLGVVHRDVAPQNLMIGYDGIVRVMDFGIAKAFDTISLTKPGMMKGTIAYMAPEQVRCQGIDRRVDVFALGTILWEATVGMRLFRHKNDVTTAARVIKMQIPPPSTLRKGYPIELERIVMKALQRDKEQRYQTAREMGEDLAEFLHKNQERVTPAVVGAFMTEIFPEQVKLRLEMEHKAREIEPPTDLSYKPPEISAESLVVVNADQELELDDLDRPVSFERLPSGSKAVTVPKGAKLEAAGQQKIPTLLTRPRGIDEPIEDEQTVEDANPDVDTLLETHDVDPSEMPPDKDPPTEVDTTSDLESSDLDEPPTKEMPIPLASGPVPEFADEDVKQTAAISFSDFERADSVTGAKPDRKKPMIAGVTAAAVLILIAVLVLAGQGEQEQPEAQAQTPTREQPQAQAETPQDPPPAEPPAEPPAQEKVKISVHVTPKNARVLVNGVPHIEAIMMPRSDQKLVIEASAAGYRREKKTITAEESQVVDIALEAMPKIVEKKKKRVRPEPPPPPASPPPPPKKTKETKKGSAPKLLFEGDDL